MKDRTLLLVIAACLLAIVVLQPHAAHAQVDVSIGSASTVSGGSARISVSGNLTSSGDFLPGQSVVAFEGADAQTVAGLETFSSVDMRKSAGTLSLGSGSVTVTDTLALTAGLLDNASSDVALGDGATIRRNSGSLAAAPVFGTSLNLVYEGDTPVATGPEVPPAGATTAIRNFTVSNSGGVKLTTPVEVHGTLALEEGALDNSEADVTVSETGTVEPGGGELAQTPTYEGPVMLVYEGQSAVTTGTELPDTVDVLRVDNPAGVTLGKDVVIMELLALQQGDLTLGGHVVTFEAPDAALHEVPGAHVTGSRGELRATRTLVRPADVDVAGLGFRISSSADLGPTTVVRTHAAPFDGDDVAIARVYDVSPTNTPDLNATVAFSYAEEELGEADEELLELYRTSDGDTWTNVGGTLDTTTNTLTIGGLDSLGRFTAGTADTRIATEDGPHLPEAFALHSAFPNPFSSRATIRYELPRTTDVRLEVYDVLGRRVATLADERQAAGVYDASLQADELSSGVYFYRLQAGSYVATHSIVLVR